MFNESTPFSMPVVPASSDGMNGGNSWIWLLIILVVLFGGNGFGNFFGGGSGSATNYTLASDFATIQRQLSDGFNSIDNALDRQNAGICDLGYTQAQLINGVNQNVSHVEYALNNAITQDTIANMQNANQINAGITALGTQLSSCCCNMSRELADLKYNMATESCATRQAIADGTKSVIDFLTQDKIATLTAENQNLKFMASQQAQTNAIVSAMNPTQPFCCGCSNN